MENNPWKCDLGIQHLYSSDVPGQCMLSECCKRTHIELWFGESSPFLLDGGINCLALKKTLQVNFMFLKCKSKKCKE